MFVLVAVKGSNISVYLSLANNINFLLKSGLYLFNLYSAMLCLFVHVKVKVDAKTKTYLDEYKAEKKKESKKVILMHSKHT